MDTRDIVLVLVLVLNLLAGSVSRNDLLRSYTNDDRVDRSSLCVEYEPV